MRSGTAVEVRITNSDIHHYAVENGVKLSEIADHLGEFETTFFKSLETECSSTRKAQLKTAIDEIRREHECESVCGDGDEA